ncbi:cell wall-binding repeat-containing protein [Catenulispora pinisilvae]|uniref:cell wall-binding repeat-containing protein n=1 Tax=Catenulispora pinisilvae TaxID=2705253 RepID=UPI0018921844|nr:cell wall-binding repeat-containing protein [Catenulispora pinisilvae]
MLRTNTGQGARDIVAPAGLSTYDVPLEGSAAVDSADSDANGEQSTDLAGHPDVTDPTLKQTGSGARDYDDRGAFEFQDPFAASLTWTQTGTFTATITAATTGWPPATSYTFDFGNGDVVTQPSPTITHTFAIKPQPGNQQFQVKVTATEAGTGTAASSSEVVGFWYEPPVVHLVTSAPLAADMKSYTLTADASSTVAGTEPIKSYTFHVIRTDTPSRPFGIAVTQASPVYTLPDALEGLYSVTVTATDALGVVTGTTQEPQSVLQDVGVRPVGAVTVQRVAGADRYLTAVAVSQQIWASASTGSADSTGRKTASAVVLATGGGFADAVAGVPLAAKTSGPLLLTAPSSLTPETAAEITRVLPAHQNKTVYVLGGTNAISEPVAAKIRALGYTVVRFGGTDRFATALDIAEQEFPNAGHVFVATGRTFPDALAAGPLAATQNAPILLSDGPELDAATASYLRRQAASAPAGSASVTAVGGDADRALTAVDGSALPHEGLMGSDRYATAAAVAAAFPQQVHTTHVGIATGEQFADALAGGAMMAALGQPLLLTTSSNLSSVDYTALYDWMELRTVSVFGGPIAVSDGTVSQIINQVRRSAG